MSCLARFAIPQLAKRSKFLNILTNFIFVDHDAIRVLSFFAGRYVFETIVGLRI